MAVLLRRTPTAPVVGATSIPVPDAETEETAPPPVIAERMAAAVSLKVARVVYPPVVRDVESEPSFLRFRDVRIAPDVSFNVALVVYPVVAVESEFNFRRLKVVLMAYAVSRKVARVV